MRSSDWWKCKSSSVSIIRRKLKEKRMKTVMLKTNEKTKFNKQKHWNQNYNIDFMDKNTRQKPSRKRCRGWKIIKEEDGTHLVSMNKAK